ncbi:MAG: hypothetical protein UV61_C0001G0085 [Candidatus Gottesmanbacteria bacterium GW2011_GWB1_43_11]|uniref:Uncharacterized protein n=1 Tax=Candidatus Gottesmanbacteria bacterium GW2011_GWB1_43_11 TaxID=1618446 RepID=A0A0G1FLA3_9BACT|nr:MAG: hypothetical protein UV04_C0004G0027 [Candidatus Gottesmanbacteria bacterium GW2011_GWA2_42_16]KKS56050.1 MAG: hypothetical protein UV17_C0003G0022 [Candidatus Gottesmanbacteria bacterium GW2011_GWA1_42_26]KKS81638.1 MAG: hypothetical protein UV55_C0011G0032 [Candidatus Gottesmanbacteria bacterium GW2011_GWC1_43_10]KKS87678.1 MAG: hypothetical protein UV61_C0001G0085 [Candidatus Gottesmanbacteria bacterium GW2011_GWB1_43_11]OGG07493.1 MAG: hypothetical protein A2699_00405 [Candidatus Go
MLSEKAILEYQQLYKKAFGVDISYEAALDQGERLVALVRTILKPIPVKRIESATKEVNT